MEVLITPQEVIETVKKLASTQGFYGRLYANWMDLLTEEELVEALTDFIIENQIKTVIDAIIIMEGW